MSSQSGTLPDSMQRGFGWFRRRWRLLQAHTGLLLSASLVVGTVGAAVAVDRLFILAPAARLSLLLLIAALALAFLAWGVVRPLVQHFSAMDTARDLGEAFPDVAEDLLTAVELSGAPQGGVSKALVHSVLAGAAARLQTVELWRAVPKRPLIKGALFLLLVAAPLLVAAWVQPEAIQNALSRLFQPRRQVPFFFYTQVRVRPGEQVVRIGDTVPIQADILGRWVHEARVEADLGVRELCMHLPNQDGRVSWTTPPLQQAMHYRVRAGDGFSPWYQVRVVPPPALQHKAAILYPPAYTGTPVQVLDAIDGPLRMVAGTRVELLATCVTRGVDPGLRCEGTVVGEDARVIMTREPAGRLRSACFTPKDSSAYRIELCDAYGLRNRAPEMVYIETVPDRVPVVRIRAPAVHVRLLPGECLRVRLEAKDEYGLRELGFRHRRVHDKHAAPRWTRQVLQTGGQDRKRLQATTLIDTGALGLQPGDQLEYRAEAADYAAEAFLRRAYSPVHRITIISEFEHLQGVLDALRHMEMELWREAAAQEIAQQWAIAAGKKAASLKSDQLRAAQDRQQRRRTSVRALAQRLSRLLPEANRNPSAPVSLLAGLKHTSSGTEAVAAGSMQRAAERLRQAAKAAGSSRSDALGAAAHEHDSAGRRLRELAHLARRLQRRALLDTLAEKAGRLVRRQLRLGEKARPLAMRSAGMEPHELSAAERAERAQLEQVQRLVKEQLQRLTRDVQATANALGQPNAWSSMCAAQAAAMAKESNLGERAQRLADLVRSNQLFRYGKDQKQLIAMLERLAQELQRAAGASGPSGLAREIECFFAEQKKINETIAAELQKEERARRPAGLGVRQTTLATELEEHVSAMRWLARELGGFESKTTTCLDEACAEMKQGAEQLTRKDLQAGLRHGQRVLDLLAKALQAAQSEGSQMQGAGQCAQMMEAALLLYRILLGQKRLMQDTQAANETPAAGRNEAPFRERLIRLAGTQGDLRGDTDRLARMLARYPGAVRLIAKASAKMGQSQACLLKSEAGKATRQAQRQAIILLEALLKQQQNNMQAMGANSQLMAMLQQLLQQMQMSQSRRGGGSHAGGNAPIAPGLLHTVEDENWRQVRSRFNERLSAEFEERFPPEYRALLHAYFERLRERGDE